MILNILLAFFAGAVIAGSLIYFMFKAQFIKQMAGLESELNSANMKNELLTQSLVEQKSLLAESKLLMNDTKTQHEELAKRMNTQFELMAQKIFEEKSAKFTDQNQKNLAAVLDPLRERIKDFEKKVEETYSNERSERSMLRGELTKMMELNKTMSTEAQNLTKALKGENKTQGNWGELILENILERSGLRKNEEYSTQGTYVNDEEKIIRPDVIVNLPDDKHIIIDSKMTLLAYEQYSSAESLEEQERFAKMHLDSLKNHIDELSKKKYHSAEKLISPDFVILFMPLEPAFALAFKLKPDLFQEAWDKNVAIVSPTTLLATLRTVAALWKQDRQEKNALEIAKRGGLLYDKFAGLLKDLQNLGEKLGAAQKAHDEVIKKVSEGRGNLIDQVEELKTLGAKTEKTLARLESKE